MLREKMHKCATFALSPLLPEKIGEPAEEELLHPVVSIAHIHNVIDRICDIYEPKVVADSAKEEGYYVRIHDTPMVHPAYMLGTFIVLLLAKPKCIFVDSFLNCEGGEETYLGDPVTGRLLKYIMKEFPELVPFENHEAWNTEKVFRLVNQNPDITQIVEIGSQVEAAWRSLYYRRNMTIHFPTANYVWVHYSTPEKLMCAKKFKKFGLYCFEEVYSYECSYDKSMKVMNEEDVYVGITYYAERDWKEFINRNCQHFPPERIPLILFGDVKPDLKVLREYHKCFKLVTQRNFNTNEIFYDFTDLLRRKEY